MAIPNHIPLTTKARRVGLTQVRPRWFFLTTFTSIFVAVCLRVGIPIYRKHVLIEAIHGNQGTVLTVKRGPEWLRNWAGHERLRLFEDVHIATTGPPMIGEAWQEMIVSIPSSC